jgi:lipopolysaccharide transport system permease protein
MVQSVGQDDRRRVKVIRPPSFSPFQLLHNVIYLFTYWDLLVTLSLHRVKVRYKQSILGYAWAILQPLSLMLIYTLIFSVVVRIKSDGMPYAIFAYTALLIWTVFSTAITSAATGLITHTNLITKVYFPREILPLTYVFAAVFDFCVASVVLAGLMIYYRIALTAMALWVIPIFVIAVVFSTSLALLLSATQVWFRDIGLAMGLVLQLWMFASPVVYPLSDVPLWLRDWYILNPMAGVVENFRRVLLTGAPPDTKSLATAAIISALLLPIAYGYFKRVDSNMADVI